MQIAEDKRVGEAGVRRLWARVRAAIVASAWGSLAGKATLYLAGFVLLAVVGAGRIHCLSAPAHEKEAPALAAPAAGVPPLATPPPEACRPDAGAVVDAG